MFSLEANGNARAIAKGRLYEYKTVKILNPYGLQILLPKIAVG
jgi:hypothetical protein